MGHGVIMSAVLQYKYYQTPTTVSGSWAGNTEAMVGMLCRQIYVKSTTTTTTFDVTVTDEKNVEIQKFTDAIGLINDLTPLPVEGIVTVTISSASADEVFTVLCVFSDK